MTDVRLTATNPEDSSVVPVACNSRGELLVEDVVVEQIDNDVTIKGGLVIDIQSEQEQEVTWYYDPEKGNFRGGYKTSGYDHHVLSRGGLTEHRRAFEDGTRDVELCGVNHAYKQIDASGLVTWSISWNGVASASNLRISLDPENPDNYTSVRNAETGEETTTYIGPVLDVREELEFLRSQVQALMERLKMTPEDGWPVWDGSDEN